ncbi:TPA: hypothetical protein ACH3X2_006961 [Trebouxia sp. C0005]
MAPKQSGQSMRCSIMCTSIANSGRKVLDACRAGLLYVAPVLLLTCALPHKPDFAMSASSTFVSAPLLVITPCMPNSVLYTCKRPAPSPPCMSGTFQLHQMCFISWYVAVYVFIRMLKF